MPFGLIFVILIVVLLVFYCAMIARSRRSTERLYDVPDDMKRADQNEKPPYDGTAGMV